MTASIIRITSNVTLLYTSPGRQDLKQEARFPFSRKFAADVLFKLKLQCRKVLESPCKCKENARISKSI